LSPSLLIMVIWLRPRLLGATAALAAVLAIGVPTAVEAHSLDSSTIAVQITDTSIDAESVSHWRRSTKPSAPTMRRRRPTSTPSRMRCSLMLTTTSPSPARTALPGRRTTPEWSETRGDLTRSPGLQRRCRAGAAGDRRPSLPLAVPGLTQPLLSGRPASAVLDRPCQEQGSGPKATVEVAEQRDLSSVVDLLIQQNSHHLASGSAAAEVARARFEQVSVAS
jgi:hypothetical protein